jgi:hypothetical protein
LKTNKINYLIIGILFFSLNLFGCDVKKDSEKKEQACPQKEKIEYKAKVAIVIDDWGYNNRLIKPTKDLGIPVTFSILPNLSYSSFVAEEANKDGYEIILHLPMESHSLIASEEVYLNAEMNNEEIAVFLDNALKSVPYAKGVSNHQGSKATENKELMEEFFAILKMKNLYFLDSLVTPETCAQQVALDKGICAYKRTVFLDNQSDFDYIKGQFQELEEIALERGSAVGICHARKSTVDALTKLVPEAKNNNIKFIFLSELNN